jgi:uncharacterized membrane protein YfcA
MKNRTFPQSFLKYWQEIVFIISIGILLFEITRFNLTQHSIDGWDFAILFLIVPLFICLIGQLYWNNKTLSIFLSFLLLMGSLIVVFMSIYFIGTTSSELPQAISMLIFGILFFYTAITMRLKTKMSLKVMHN